MIVISIHAPRVGGDRSAPARRWRRRYFNPRPPCGGRRLFQRGERLLDKISIHAPRVGGDFLQGPPRSLRPFISIHAPRVGGDSWCVAVGGIIGIFQSTPPVWGATYVILDIWYHVNYFNPRPPCGGRRSIVRTFSSPSYFNPRPPCGGRRGGHQEQNDALDISIHAPRVGGDSSRRHRRSAGQYFNPRPPCGGRQIRP